MNEENLRQYYDFFAGLTINLDLIARDHGIDRGVSKYGEPVTTDDDGNENDADFKRRLLLLMTEETLRSNEDSSFYVWENFSTLIPESTLSINPRPGIEKARENRIKQWNLGDRFGLTWEENNNPLVKAANEAIKRLKTRLLEFPIDHNAYEIGQIDGIEELLEGFERELIGAIVFGLKHGVVNSSR